MKYLSIITAALLSLYLASCATNGGNYPQVADAPPFDYVDGDELRSRMHQLAFELQRLDSDLATDYDERSPIQQDIVDKLGNIERIAQTLQSGDLNSKHPFLLDDMEKFIADVSRAKWDAERRQYYMAGRITGSCVSCHKAQY